jgi:hypothetical protein
MAWLRARRNLETNPIEILARSRADRPGARRPRDARISLKSK